MGMFKDALVELLSPMQVGIGVSGAGQVAAHIIREFLQRRKDGVCLKVDMRNAFNSIKRSCILEELTKSEPLSDLKAYFTRTYLKPTSPPATQRRKKVRKKPRLYRFDFSL